MADGEEPTVVLLHIRVVELFFKSIYAHVLHHFPEQYLQEHPMRGCGGVLLQYHNLQYLPVNAKSMQEVAVQFCQISDLINLQFEHCVVVVHKCLHEEIFVHIGNGAESLCKEPEKLLVDPFHHAALQDHVNQLTLVTFGDVHLHYFVGTFLEIYRRLYCQVNCTT